MFDQTEPMLAMLYENPLDKLHRGVLADWCDEHDLAAWADVLRANRIPLSVDDRFAVVALKSCRFAPATWEKKFARDLNIDRNASLTPRQYLWLWILLRKFRRSVESESIREEAERRYERYRALHAAEMVKPAYEPLPDNNRAQEHYRKKRKTHKANLQEKAAEMPLFD